jgi:Dockerin type I domain
MPQGGEFRVNDYTPSDQNLPSAAMDADGDFVVTWHGYEQARDHNGVYARQFNAAGVAQGGDIPVNTFQTSFQRHTAIAMDSGGDFVISWQNEFVDANQGGTSVDAQRFASGGARVGAEFRVNSTTLGNHRYPAAAMDADGDFVIAWASYGQDPGDGANNSGVYAQRYAADRPAVTAGEFLYRSSPNRVSITFSQDVSATLAAADLSVVLLGPGGGPVAFLAPAYNGATNTATITFAGAGILPNGNYRLTLVAAGVTNAAGTPVAANFVLDFFALTGDVNRDRSVNGTDFAILAGNFGKTGRTYEQGDLNGDGSVNGSDFALLAGNFGKSVPAPAAQQSVVVSSPPQGAATAPPPRAARRVTPPKPPASANRRILPLTRKRPASRS